MSAGLCRLIGIILARVGWQVCPAWWSCLYFWFFLFLDRWFSWRDGNARFDPLGITIFSGQVMNCVVTLANHGVMPVLGLQGTFISVWAKATSKHHLLFLCDRLRWGFSIGDIFIIVPLVISLFVPWKIRLRYDLFRRRVPGYDYFPVPTISAMPPQ